MLDKLGSLLDVKADEKTLLRARTIATVLRFDFLMTSGESPSSAKLMAFRRGVGGFITGLGEYEESVTESSRSADEVIENFSLKDAAAEAYRKGATIGELFLLQPSLFI